jgi:hypothetical protein
MLTKIKFRCLLIAALTSIIAGALTYHFLDRPNMPIDLQHYLKTRSSSVLSSYFTMFSIESLAYLVFSAISFVGLYFFWRPARFFYCGSIVIDILMSLDPNFGPNIVTRWLGFFDFCHMILSGVILCAIFMSPIKELFENKDVTKM